MIVKFFRQGTNSGQDAVGYLLGKNRDRKDARLLNGDSEKMVELIDSLDFKNKYTSGVLSFYENDIEEEKKEELMRDFEKMLLPGLHENMQFLWIEHRDKDRLELNFVIANVELEQGRSVTPYLDKIDRGRVDTWKKTVNLEHGFHDPDDLKNSQKAATRDLKSEDLTFERLKIHSYLRSEIEAGRATNRDDVIELLNRHSTWLHVSRVSPKSVTVTMAMKKDNGKEQKIRLKGALFEEEFKTLDTIRGGIESIIEQEKTNKTESLEKLKDELKSRVEHKAEKIKTRYILNSKTSSNSTLTLENTTIDQVLNDQENRISESLNVERDRQYFDDTSPKSRTIRTGFSSRITDVLRHAAKTTQRTIRDSASSTRQKIERAKDFIRSKHRLVSVRFVEANEKSDRERRESRRNEIDLSGTRREFEGFKQGLVALGERVSAIHESSSEDVSRRSEREQQTIVSNTESIHRASNQNISILEQIDERLRANERVSKSLGGEDIVSVDGVAECSDIEADEVTYTRIR